MPFQKRFQRGQTLFTASKAVASLGLPVLVLLNALFSTPIISIKGAQKITKLSVKAAGGLVQAFVELGILKEVSEQRRNRVYAFSEYIALFEKE